MRNLLTITVTSVILLGCGSTERREEIGSQTKLIGAWLITETSVTTPDGTTTNENPQPGVYIFTEQHFSNMLIPSVEGRLPFSSQRTDEERLAAYDNFIADAGTYEISGSEITVHNIIAKEPNVMPPFSVDDDLIYGYSFDGESMVLTLRGGWAPPEGEITYRLDRLE